MSMQADVIKTVIRECKCNELSLNFASNLVVDIFDSLEWIDGDDLNSDEISNVMEQCQDVWSKS